MGKPEADPNFCWIHHVIEKPGTIRCGECFHWFADDAELIADHNAQPFLKAASVEEIYSCPHCSHDF
jgi:hypothetical protein